MISLAAHVCSIRGAEGRAMSGALHNQPRVRRMITGHARRDMITQKACDD
jgi:hypothetical protein